MKFLTYLPNERSANRLNQPLNRAQLSVANAIRIACIGARRTTFTEALLSRKIIVSRRDHAIIRVFTQGELMIVQPDSYITWPVGLESDRPMVFRLKLRDNKNEVIVSREGYNYCFYVAAFNLE